MTSIKNDLNGWFVVDKPKNLSSGGVIGQLKFLFHPKKIGHAGTLDPLATGVLPVALGKATRLIPFVMEGTKTYEFDIQWGVETDSDDLGGTIIASSPVRPKKQDILKILPQFTGNILQTPSPYSAIKINGKRAYELARQGKQVQIPVRHVIISQLQLVKKTRMSASFIAQVSKGTYIRTLAHDIAHALGTVGVVTRLHRIQDGPFTIDKAVLPQNLTLEALLPLESVLGHLPRLDVSMTIAERICHGQRIKEPILTRPFHEKIPVAVWYQEELIAIVCIEKGVIHPLCVLKF